MPRSRRYGPGKAGYAVVSAITLFAASGVLTGCSSSQPSSSGLSTARQRPRVTRVTYPVSTFSDKVVIGRRTTRLPLGSGGILRLGRGHAPLGAVLSASSKRPPAHWSVNAEPLHAPIHIRLSSGRLHGKAELSFPYNPAVLPKGVPPSSAMGIATYDPVKRAWLNVPVRVDRRSHRIVAEVSHFSWWAPWTWDWTNLGAEISNSVLSLLGKRTGRPTCSNEPLPSYVQNVVTESDQNDPLYSCAANAGGTLEVKLVDNRNYADVLIFPVRVSAARADAGGNLFQAGLSKILFRNMGQNRLYIPPLGSAYVKIPNTHFKTATFTAGPTKRTLLADIAQIVFGGLDLAEFGPLLAKVAEACGQFITTAPLPTSLTAVYELVGSAGDCLAKASAAAAHAGLFDQLKASQLQRLGGSLTFLEHLDIVGVTIGVADEIGDLVLGRTVDQPLRQFTVYHAVSAPPRTSPPTTAPSTTAPTSYQPGSHFDDYCVIAWPTAPVYTSNAIQMTMSCVHVDENTYLFTVVQYDDPNFKPTPDSGQMHVVGTVIGTAHSDYGYNELEVLASNVTFTSQQ
jgi:hypothetical protein